MPRHLPFFYVAVLRIKNKTQNISTPMKKRPVLLLFACCITCISVLTLNADLNLSTTQEEKDKRSDEIGLLEEIQAKAEQEKWGTLPFNELVAQVGLQLRGIPYTSGSLEGEVEECKVTLSGLDCVTFFESTLAIAQMLRADQTLDVPSLHAQVQKMRYRDGVVDGYTSRLHYFVDWGYENQVHGIVRDVTPTFARTSPDTRTINFMSTHINAYPALKNSPSNVERIKKIEDAINDRERFLLKKNYIGETEKNLQSGDIVGITTTIKGLDVSHTGMIFRDEEGKVRLLHASLTQKKVILDVELKDYLAGNSKQTGVIVLRPVDPAAPKE